MIIEFTKTKTDKACEHKRGSLYENLYIVYHEGKHKGIIGAVSKAQAISRVRYTRYGKIVDDGKWKARLLRRAWTHDLYYVYRKENNRWICAGAVEAWSPEEAINNIACSEIFRKMSADTLWGATRKASLFDDDTDEAC